MIFQLSQVTAKLLTAVCVLLLVPSGAHCQVPPDIDGFSMFRGETLSGADQIGQVIRLPANRERLFVFDFFALSAYRISFEGGVYEWDIVAQAPVGPRLAFVPYSISESVDPELVPRLVNSRIRLVFENGVLMDPNKYYVVYASQIMPRDTAASWWTCTCYSDGYGRYVEPPDGRWTGNIGQGPGDFAFRAYFTDLYSPLGLKKVTSRKAHGDGITYDLPVLPYVDINQMLTVEPRKAAPDHLIVFHMTGPVYSVGSLNVVDKTGATVPIDPPEIAINEIRVRVKNASSNARLSFAAMGVNGTKDFTTAIGFLQGDVSGSRTVNATDIILQKLRRDYLGMAITPQTFKYDIDLSGTIDQLDVDAAKAMSGTKLN